MRFKRSLALAAVGLLSTTAVVSAAHDSQNLIDFARTEIAPEGADGLATSLYNPGTGLWSSQAVVTGLAANQMYTFWGEGPTPATGAATKFPICSFTTDDEGRGSCSRADHELPGLANARIREGTDTQDDGAIQLTAGVNPAQVDERMVRDGEITRIILGAPVEPPVGGESTDGQS